VAQQLKSLLGEQSTGMIESMMTARKTGGSLMATIIGGAGLLLGASGVFGQLQDALNTIWEVKSKPGGGIWGFLRNRFLSFGMVLVIGFLLLLSMVLTTFVSAAAGQLSNVVEVPEWIMHGVNLLATFGVVTVLFAAIFKFLPDVKIGWSDVWVGAVVTALLYAVGKMGLGWYLGRESTASAYGAGGAFIVILLYIYYSTIILFFGAEFTQVYARVRGSRIVPSKHAIPVTDDERAQQGMPSEGRREGAPRPRPVHSGVAHRPAPALARFMRPANKQMTHGMSNLPPLEQLRTRPYSFIGLALATGMAAGLLWKFKTLRTGLKWYLAARRLL
jgi:membrane protein